MGDNVREWDFGARRRLVCDSSSDVGDGMIDGKPMDGGSSTLSRNVGELKELSRCRVFDTSNVGDFSRTRSSNVLVLGLLCDGGGPTPVAEGSCLFGNDGETPSRDRA
jgi:hypothetical protein